MIKYSGISRNKSTFGWIFKDIIVTIFVYASSDIFISTISQLVTVNTGLYRTQLSFLT